MSSARELRLVGARSRALNARVGTARACTTGPGGASTAVALAAVELLRSLAVSATGAAAITSGIAPVAQPQRSFCNSRRPH